ncbi:hypothetical protein Tsubulata_040860, partial [Turnera subulata]
MLKLTGSLILVWWLLVATSTQAQTWPFVVDTDGKPLTSGTEYYILPAATDIAGGLTLVNRNGSCPLHVGQEPLGVVVSHGIPVTFAPRVTREGNIIRETRDFTIQFSGSSICGQSTTWRVGEVNRKTGRRSVVAGSVASSSVLGFFNIVKNELNLYILEWCPNCLSGNCPKPRCGSAGVVVENRKRLLLMGSLTLVWLAMATLSWAQSDPAVLDTQGRPLTSGTEYYINPAATDIAGGLTLEDKNNSCPLYVGQEALGSGSRGFPVTFRPRDAADGNTIREGRDFTVQFEAASTCVMSTAWRVGQENPDTRRRYIVASGSQASSTLQFFNIVRGEQGLYTIRWCPNCVDTSSRPCPRPRCGSAGIVVEDGKRF